MRIFKNEALDDIEWSLAGHGLSLASEAERYRLAILAEVEKIQIVIPVLPWATLVDRARAHEDAGLAGRNARALDSEEDEALLERIALSYLCSLFKAQYQRVYYATLAVEAPSLLRARVLNAIADVYPRLSDAAIQAAEGERTSEA